MSEQALAVLAGAVFLYAIVSRGIERTPFGGAVAFAAVGVLLGPDGLNLLDLRLDSASLRILAELTLALVLFTDAAKVNVHELIRITSLARGLLLVGLPLTFLLGWLVALPLLPELGLAGAALLAATLAPTDAALGKAVVEDPRVPESLRTGLDVESGVNDGVVVPVFLTFLAVATESLGGTEVLRHGARLLVEEIGIGTMVGVVLTLAALLLVRFGARLGWIAADWRPALVPAFAIACFATAQVLGGSGFIACFAAGITYGRLAGHAHHEALQAGDAVGDALALVTWLLFGASAFAPAIQDLRPEILLYALLSLTLVRMLPVWIALRRTGMKQPEILFVGWFGPRGLASIVFAVMALDAGIPGADTIALTAACTIFLSILAHGVTAQPLAALLARRLRRSRQGEE